MSLLAALLTVGSLSDHLGRKPVIFAALVLNMLAMLLFIHADSVAWLIAARTLQGFATGMATAVLGAALLDTDRQQGPLVNSVAPLLGMACGAMGSSLLVEFAPLPTQLIYWALFALMLVQSLYVWQLPESVSRMPGALASLWPTLHVPPQARRALWLSLPVDIAVWAMGGFTCHWHRRWCARRPVRLQPDRWRSGRRVDPQWRGDDLQPAQSPGR